ncbi:hypothetical protein [Nostoc sp.]
MLFIAALPQIQEAINPPIGIPSQRLGTRESFFTVFEEYLPILIV